MADDGSGTERTVVKTYVPAHQKETWADHADRLGMSQSEFVRTMVQAGRRGFEPDPEEPGSHGSNPRGDGLEDRVLRHLSEADSLGWDELVAALTDDVEQRLEDTIDELQKDDLIRHDPRSGGYVLVEGSE